MTALQPNAHGPDEITVQPGVWEKDASDASVRAVAALVAPADPLARFHYMGQPSRVDTPLAQRLRAFSLAYFRDEAGMADASVANVISSGRATHAPRVWVVTADTQSLSRKSSFSDGGWMDLMAVSILAKCR